MSAADSAPLGKELGLGGVFSIAAGAMISSGLFILPGIAFGLTGPSVVVAYALAALLYMPAMFAQAELASAMPASGGSYFTIERSLGALAGTIAGFVNWFSIALKAAFAFVGLGSLVMLLVPEWGEWGLKAGALGGCALFTVLNLVSVKETGRVQTVMVAVMIVILGLFVAGGIGEVEATRYSGFLRGGVESLLAVTGMVFVSFGGLTKVVDVGGEVREPHRNLPRGMFLAFGVVNVIYVLAVFIAVGVLPAEALSGSLTPLADTARKTLGDWGYYLLGAAAFMAYATTGNAGILSASRSPMAMSRDGLLPAVLSRTSARYATPTTAILFTGGAMALAILLLNIEDLVKTASTMLLLSFVLMNVSVIVMRRSGIEGYRPAFRGPLNPWLPASAVIVYSFLIAEMGHVPLITTGVFLLAAGTWYFVYVDQRIHRESAIVYMVNTILSRHIKRGGLEDELVQISLAREEVEKDRFDKLVSEAAVLDIENPIRAKELFLTISETLAPRIGLDAEKLYSLFLERERESSTVIQPGLAIPHIIVDGENVFEVALVRCREGAIFSDLNEPVRAAFVLVGSPDQRNFHLKALVAIARVVQEPGFDARWMEARNAGQLRDIVILSGRTRVNA